MVVEPIAGRERSGTGGGGTEGYRIAFLVRVYREDVSLSFSLFFSFHASLVRGIKGTGVLFS